MKKDMMADVNHEEFVGTTILTPSQDKMADQYAEKLAAEAKWLVNLKKPAFWGITKEEYSDFVSRIELTAKLNFSDEVAKVWKRMCHAYFDDFLFENFTEMEEAAKEQRSEARIMVNEEKAQKQERKAANKKRTLERKAIRRIKHEW